MKPPNKYSLFRTIFRLISDYMGKTLFFLLWGGQKVCSMSLVTLNVFNYQG